MVAWITQQQGQPAATDRAYLARLDAHKHAMELRPDVPFLIFNLAWAYLEYVRVLLDEGRDPTAYFAKVEALLSLLQTKHPTYETAWIVRLVLDHAKLLYSLQKNLDITDQVQKLVTDLRQRARKLPNYYEVLNLEGEAYLTLSEALLAQGVSPLGVVDEALQEVANMNPLAIGAEKSAVLSGQLRLLQARALRQARRSPEPALRRFLSDTEPAGQRKDRARTELLTLRAQALRLLAVWLRDQHREPAALAAIDQALATCTEARQKGRSRLSGVLAEEGALWSLQAQLLRPGTARQQAAGQAVTALEQVLSTEPPRGRDLNEYLKAAQGIVQPAQRLAP
jgi:hypothetical protein